MSSAVNDTRSSNYPTLTMNTGVASGIYDSDISKDGKYLYVLNSEGSHIEVRNAKTGSIIKRVTYDVGDGNAGFVHSLVSADNYRVIISSRNNNLYLIDIVSEKVVKSADLGAYYLKMIPNRDKSKAILIYGFRTESGRGRETAKYSYIIDTSNLEVITKIKAFKCNYRIPFCNIFDIAEERRMPYTAAAFGENGDFYLASTYLLYHHKNFDDPDGEFIRSEKGDRRIVGLEALPGDRLVVATDNSTVSGTGALSFYAGKTLQSSHELTYTTDSFDEPDNLAGQHYIPIKYYQGKNVILSQGKAASGEKYPGMLFLYDAVSGKRISSEPLVTSRGRFNSADLIDNSLVAVNSTYGIKSVDLNNGKPLYSIENSFSLTRVLSKDSFYIVSYNPAIQELVIHRNKKDYGINIGERTIKEHPKEKIAKNNVKFIKYGDLPYGVDISEWKNDDDKTFTRITLKNGNVVVNSRKNVIIFDNKFNEVKRISTGFRNINGISINDEESIIGIVGNSTSFSLVDLKTDHVIWDRKYAHNNILSDVRYSNGYWITASYDGMIKFWPSGGGEALVTAAFSSVEDKVGSEGFIVTTRDGFFDVLGNTGSWAHFSSASSMETFSYNQLFETFFRPDIVKKTLNRSTFVPVPVDDYSRPLKMPPPELSYALHKAGGNSYDFTVNLKDVGGGVGALRVTNNGKLIYQSNDHYRLSKSPGVEDDNKGESSSPSRRIAAGAGVGRELLLQQSNSSSYNVRLDLPFKTNNLTLQAFNSAGTVMSMIHQVAVEADTVPKNSPRMHIVSIGINKFVDATANLGNAAKDASAISAIFSRFSAYEPGEIVTLLDEKASKAAIVATFQKLDKIVKPHDVVVVYFATHAFTDEKGQFYLFTHDFNGQVTAADTLMYSELLRLHLNLPAYQQLWMFDTCYAGGINNAVSDVYNSRSLVFSKSSGMYIVTSTTASQQAFENYGGYGLLTYVINNMAKDSQGKKSMDMNSFVVTLMHDSKKASSTTQIATATVHGGNLALLDFAPRTNKTVNKEPQSEAPMKSIKASPLKTTKKGKSK